MKNYYMITYKEDGEEKTIDSYETEESLKKRIHCYRKANCKIISVVKKVITTTWINVKY